ncbi:glutamyl-tRNA reductase [Methanogenium sp. MK-MG]|uniref:glutamyl-tRNA reductase n=1 Tax=Methanogenium sp. MK-MG TaxID=2599926 RepID=UPI0013E9B176|nr:glutamyl-tRNA reductase [Methanogenium sp. MK-MG]KAF1078288.1 Glutamyl-tRNA reductase [Methanogenium sp. MK-MG]
MKNGLIPSVAIAGISHHGSDIAELESFRFPDEAALLSDAQGRFKGALLLQTCNRIEFLVEGDACMAEAFLREQGRDGFRMLEGEDALRHLLRLSAGMDSMVVGEDQILGQLKAALALSRENDTCSPLMERCITKAVHVGVEVRRRTNINKGAVSIGSAAVELAEDLLGSLDGRHILVVGGGEIGTLVTQALAAKDLTAIYVTNRTFARAEELAELVGGKAVRLDELFRYAALADVIISCTAAPHPIIRCDEVCDAMRDRIWPLDEGRKPLVIIDIAQPRDVEGAVGDIDGVYLFTIDDLRTVSENNMNSRKEEAKEAHAFLDAELMQFVTLLNRTGASDVLAHLHSWAEMIRCRERDKAAARLRSSGASAEEIIDDLSRVLVKKLLNDVTFSVRRCAESGELESAQALVHAVTAGDNECFRKDD